MQLAPPMGSIPFRQQQRHAVTVEGRCPPSLPTRSTSLTRHRALHGNAERHRVPPCSPCTLCSLSYLMESAISLFFL